MRGGEEERKPNGAAKCRFKRTFIKWRVFGRPDYHLLLVTFPPPPNRGGYGGKLYCSMRGCLESAQLGLLQLTALLLRDLEEVN